MDTTADRVVGAAKEVNDIVELITNDKPNGQEIMDFIKEIVEAGGKSFMLSQDLTKEEYGDALGVIGAAIGGKIASDRVIFKDGSKVIIKVEAVPLELSPE